MREIFITNLYSHLFRQFLIDALSNYKGNLYSHLRKRILLRSHSINEKFFGAYLYSHLIRNIFFNALSHYCILFCQLRNCRLTSGCKRRFDSPDKQNRKVLQGWQTLAEKNTTKGVPAQAFRRKAAHSPTGAYHRPSRPQAFQIVA